MLILVVPALRLPLLLRAEGIQIAIHEEGVANVYICGLLAFRAHRCLRIVAIPYFEVLLAELNPYLIIVARAVESAAGSHARAQVDSRQAKYYIVQDFRREVKERMVAT